MMGQVSTQWLWFPAVMGLMLGGPAIAAEGDREEIDSDATGSLVQAASTVPTIKLPHQTADILFTTQASVEDLTQVEPVAAADVVIADEVTADEVTADVVTASDPQVTVSQLDSSSQANLPIVAIASPSAIAVTPTARSSQPTVSPSALRSDAAVLNQLEQYSAPLTTSDSLAQVPSVTQFSDVQPTDWAYQALQSLVERYGCIVGYPDGTFKGQRALTRYEFAAGMNACLDRISELLAASTADLATKEDLATLQRLQEEFAAELATLRGRVDTLDGRVAALEANQFSTTTKLTGETIFGVAQAFGGGLEDETDLENQTLAAGRVRLTFDTSFFGSDRLRARLQAGNFGRFLTTDESGNTVLGNEGRLGFDTDSDNEFEIDILSYLFPVGDSLEFFIAGQLSDFYQSDLVPTVSPFSSSGRGALSRFGRFSPLYRTASGAGAGVSLDLDVASLQFAYLASEGGDANAGAGLLNGDYGALAQLTLTPVESVTLALTYVNSYAGSDNGEAIGFETGTGSSRSQVQVDAPVIVNSYGLEANFQIADFLEVGGWIGYSAVRALETGDADVWNYAGTLAFPDLGGKGNLLGFVVGVEPRLAGTTGFQVNGRRSDPDTGLHVEGFYRFQLNDNISITPGVIWLTAPNHDADHKDVVIGAIRTTFSF